MAALSQTPIGRSEAFHQLMDQISDVAALERSVLITGERGTGKELIASRLHFLSPRWEQVFISVNCAAFDAEALDVTLFGRVYFDGTPDLEGQFTRANGGTLFLDNIETMPLRLQEKLLQTLEYSRIDPLGSPDTEDVDVRVVASTSVDLPSAVAAGAFRADLVDSIAFDVIALPPLRERPDDIEPLAAHFGRKFTADLGAEHFPGFTPEALEQLMTQPLRGNVRSLKVAVERSLAKAFLADESLSLPISELVLDPFDGPYRLKPMAAPPVPQTHAGDVAQIEDQGQSSTQPLDSKTANVPESVQEFAPRIFAFERRLIDEALQVGDGHQGKAAEHLGLTYHQFRGLLRKHGLKK
ncbi:MAG: sigma 54-interacting transcriptional regulator [Maricaulaceae bacterium]